VTRIAAPGWVEHVMWWHVYPLGFLGADTTGGDRSAHRTLADIEPWLEYVLELGLNGVVLAPIFESETHGYDTVDYYRIDARLGDERDFDGLIAAAHARGIRVLLDGVFNHVGRGFVAPESYPPASDLVQHAADGSLVPFEGHDALVTLDHADDRVADLVVDVMTYWLGRGVDGWRLDAAYAVPSEFWAHVLPRVRALYPDAYLMGEYLHGDYPALVRAGALDSATQYELWQAIWHSIADANFFELDWALRRHDEFLAVFTPYTFIGNHDVTRIASQIADPRHHAHAVVLLMTLGGTPAVYYGDERGERAVKEQRAGGDDGIRPAYPVGPDAFGDDRGEVFRLHQELIGLRRRHAWLTAATSHTISLTNTQYVFEVSAGSSRLLVALNLDDRELDVPTAAESLRAGDATRSAGVWRVRPHAWAILE